VRGHVLLGGDTTTHVLLGRGRRVSLMGLEGPGGQELVQGFSFSDGHGWRCLAVLHLEKVTLATEPGVRLRHRNPLSLIKSLLDIISGIIRLHHLQLVLFLLQSSLHGLEDVLRCLRPRVKVLVYQVTHPARIDLSATIPLPHVCHLADGAVRVSGGSAFKLVGLHHLCLWPGFLDPQLPLMLWQVTLDDLSLLLVKCTLWGPRAFGGHHLVLIVITAILEPGGFDPELEHLA